MQCKDESSSHKAKGVKRGTKMTHPQYVDIFKSFHPDLESPPSPKRVCVDQRRIGSVNHDVFTSLSSKLALSINDDKRAWTGPNSSLPYGHYRLQQWHYVREYVLSTTVSLIHRNCHLQYWPHMQAKLRLHLRLHNRMTIPFAHTMSLRLYMLCLRLNCNYLYISILPCISVF